MNNKESLEKAFNALFITLKAIYLIPILPILIIIVVKLFRSPDFVWSGDISEELKNRIKKNKWFFRLFCLFFWMVLIIKIK